MNMGKRLCEVGGAWAELLPGFRSAAGKRESAGKGRTSWEGENQPPRAAVSGTYLVLPTIVGTHVVLF